MFAGTPTAAPMPLRSALALAILFATAAVHAQGGLTATQVGNRLTISNETAAPVTLDSIRIASVEITDGQYRGSTSARYVASFGGKGVEGGFHCSPFRPGMLCQEGGGTLFGHEFALGDLVRFVSFEVVCDICRPAFASGGLDTMRVYSGGVAVPFNVPMPSELYVAGEAAPEAPAFRLGVSPNPARGAAVLALAQPAPGAVRVVATDALGREVAVLHDGPAGEALLLRFDTASWPPGMYMVRAEASGRVASARFVVMR